MSMTPQTDQNSDFHQYENYLRHTKKNEFPFFLLPSISYHFVILLQLPRLLPSGHCTLGRGLFEATWQDLGVWDGICKRRRKSWLLSG